MRNLPTTPQLNTSKPSLQHSNSPSLQSADLGQLRAQSNLIQQVETQFLNNADPAAKNKFNELMGGLISGKLSVNDIRAEAKSAADQLRSLKKETGDETGLFDSYLAILDKFLRETPPGPVLTNAPVSDPKPKPAVRLEH